MKFLPFLIGAATWTYLIIRYPKLVWAGFTMKDKQLGIFNYWYLVLTILVLIWAIW